MPVERKVPRGFEMTSANKKQIKKHFFFKNPPPTMAPTLTMCALALAAHLGLSVAQPQVLLTPWADNSIRVQVRKLFVITPSFLTVFRFQCVRNQLLTITRNVGII